MPDALIGSAVETLVADRDGDVDIDDLSQAFDDLVSRGAAAWPDFRPSLHRLAVVAARVIADAAVPGDALRGCDARELWLAAACVEQQGGALRALDRDYIALLDAALAATRLDTASIAEVKQRVRSKLLGTDEDGVMRLAKYCGRGKLAAMAKVIAIRSAVDLKRVSARHPERAVTGDELAVQRLVDGGLGPELSAVTHEQRSVLKDAFEAAVAELPPLDRGVLRLHLVEGLAIDDIATLHSVHRATAARWLSRIRTTLGELTRTTLADRLRLADPELNSWLRMVTAELDLSLSRVFVEPQDD